MIHSWLPKYLPFIMRNVYICWFFFLDIIAAKQKLQNVLLITISRYVMYAKCWGYPMATLLCHHIQNFHWWMQTEVQMTYSGFLAWVRQSPEPTLSCVETVMKRFVQTEALCNMTQCSVTDSFFMGNVGCKGRCVIILCLQKPSEGHLKWEKKEK